MGFMTSLQPLQLNASVYLKVVHSLLNIFCLAKSSICDTVLPLS